MENVKEHVKNTNVVIIYILLLLVYYIFFNINFFIVLITNFNF
jgi:hypothetical protein